MNRPVNEEILDSRLSALESARSWSPRLVSRLENHIRNADDAGLFRLNPIGFAAARGLDEAETIDLLLHAAAHGLFTMDWLLVCPRCSGAVESFRSLRSLDQNYYCNFCHQVHVASLDDYIVVAFTIAPDIRDIIYHHPETLTAADYSLVYKWLDLGRWPNGLAMSEAMRSATQAIEFLPPSAVTCLTVEAAPGSWLKGWTVDGDAHFRFDVAGAPQTGGQTVTLGITPDGGLSATGPLAPGPVTFHIENQSKRRMAFGIAVLPEGFVKPPLTFDPFLSGKRLVTTQTFRDLFRAEVVGATEGIGVKDISLLFTDLKGSTALYDRIGDLTAFALVQGHFERLRDVTADNRGAVIKTIGDAVMAAFSDPADAVRAALEMLREIDAFNHASAHRDLVLKIGIHKGAAIAVTLNDRLDYFGQTVNIAARVQGLADTAEIYLTRNVRESPGVASLLDGLSVTEQVAQLKGVGEEMIVYRLVPMTGS